MSKKLTTKEFIAKSKNKHGDIYDYRLSTYVNSASKINIICPKHGVFSQLANAHMQGRGCRKCADEDNHTRFKNNSNNVKEKFIKVHGNKYSYDKMDYYNRHTKITITCPYHGDFEQTPGSHVAGRGCPRCNHVNISKRQFKSTADFIKGATKKHGSLYSYANSSYIDSYAKIEIMCNKHGSFFQRPNDHLMGSGCPKCGHQISKAEIEVADFIRSLGFTIQRNSRKIFKNSFKEADIFIPSKNLIIEYDGNIWHSEHKNTDKYNVLTKTKLANDNGFNCMHIRDDQWLKQKNLIKELIKSRLGIFNNRIGARKTNKQDITSKEYSDLCQHHLQGYRAAKHKRGLFYNGELVAAIGYDNAGELIRYVVKNGWQVLGALPKLIKNENIKFSFCDLTFFDGSSYPKAGFKLDYITKPNYRYVKRDVTVSRNSMMKHKLKNKFLNYDDSLTEVQNCANNGWYRLFDCGNAKYIL